MFNFFERRKLRKRIAALEAQHKYLSNTIASAQKQQRQIERFLPKVRAELARIDGRNPQAVINEFEREVL